MRLTVQSDALTGSNNDLLLLPPHLMPWQKIALHDHDLRLLLNATFRNRERLEREFADVPVQDYEVLPAERSPSGALSVGALIALWYYAPLCRGGCPHCGDQTLAMHVGGAGEQWQVLGVCQWCGGLAYRAVSRPQLFAELELALQDTPFNLPSADQLMSMNGMPFTALCDALRECGEVLLPPAHYGFLGGNAEFMVQWSNSTRERAWRWAKAVALDPSVVSADQEPSFRIALGMFSERYFLRTGRFPELAHDIGDGQVVTFPMISQHPLTALRKPTSAHEAWESEDTEDAQDEAQAYAAVRQACETVLVERLRNRAQLDDVLRSVQHLIGMDRANLETGTQLGRWLDPEAMRTAFSEVTADVVRHGMLAPRWQRVSRARRLAYFERYVLPSLFETSQAISTFVAIPVRGLDGRHAVVIAGVPHDADGDGALKWWGVGPTPESFRDHLVRLGWAESAEAFSALPTKQKLALLEREEN